MDHHRRATLPAPRPHDGHGTCSALCSVDALALFLLISLFRDLSLLCIVCSVSRNYDAALEQLLRHLGLHLVNFGCFCLWMHSSFCDCIHAGDREKAIERYEQRKVSDRIMVFFFFSVGAISQARHFETLQSIRDMIDSLPYAKINVLHWHMSDSQSFPMQSHTHPFLWNGSWSKEERYTQQDIASIVEYARMRGVGERFCPCNALLFFNFFVVAFLIFKRCLSLSLFLSLYECSA